MRKPENQAFLVPKLPPELLDRPLDYLAADHDRHRAVCSFLKEVVREGVISSASAEAVAGFLNTEFPLHLEDEHSALYPALMRRSRDDDEFVASIQRMIADHDHAAASRLPVALGLREAGRRARTTLPPHLVEALRGYVDEEERRLAFENAVIMTIAGVRLKKIDLDAIRSSMKIRRGIIEP